MVVAGFSLAERSTVVQLFRNKPVRTQVAASADVTAVRVLSVQRQKLLLEPVRQEHAVLPVLHFLGHGVQMLLHTSVNEAINGIMLVDFTVPTLAQRKVLAWRASQRSGYGYS